jgi:hypothetical protein
MLVFALGLEEVEEVGCCCVDRYQILIWLWNGIGKRADGQIIGSLSYLAVEVEDSIRKGLRSYIALLECHAYREFKKERLLV